MIRVLVTAVGKTTTDPEDDSVSHFGCEYPIRLTFIDYEMSAFATLTLHEKELDEAGLKGLPQLLVSKAAQLSLSIDELEREMETQRDE